MQSIYYCKECFIDFPTVTQYIKHRKLFCELGRHTVNGSSEQCEEDGIGKLTISQASSRIQRAIERRLKDIDPVVYETVDELERYKRKRREEAHRVRQVRGDVLKVIEDLRFEQRSLQSAFTDGNKRYEAIKAYSEISSLETENVDGLLKQLADLKNAMVYVSDEINANIDKLDMIENGQYSPAAGTKAVSRDLTRGTTRDRSTQQSIRYNTTALKTPAVTPLVEEYAVRPTTHHTTPPSAIPPSTHHTTPLKPQTADSVVLLGKLQRKRDILQLRKEIETMELEQQQQSADTALNVLQDTVLMGYKPDQGFVVYLDYVTPTFHITSHLAVTLYRDKDPISRPATYVVSTSNHVMYLGYYEVFYGVPASGDVFLHIAVQSLDGEELGWCLFGVFGDEILNSGAWRVPLKTPPFTTDLVSSLYHGVRSQNYSVRIRCSLCTVHDRMLQTDKLQLPQYNLHTPLFQDCLIKQPLKEVVSRSTPKNRTVRASSLDHVIQTYGPPGDYDPIKVLKKGGSARGTPLRPHPAATPHATPAPPIVRIRGLHYQALKLPSSTQPLTVHVSLCEFNEEFHIISTTEDLTRSDPTRPSTLLNHYQFNNEKIELEWTGDDVLLLFCFVGEQGSCWSYVRYSDKQDELGVFSDPAPSFQHLLAVIEDEEAGVNSPSEHPFAPLEESVFWVRYYDTAESVPSYPGKITPDPKLSHPRLPTGAFRHVEQKPNFTPHNPKKPFTLVIDGARYLPSCVTVTRGTGRIFDREYNVVGPQIDTKVQLDGDVYNPTYKYCVEIPGDIPNTAIAVLKLYTLHVSTGDLTTVGYCILNLFCKRGSTSPAEAKDSTVVLNIGPQQIPLYTDGPSTGQPLKMDILDDVPKVPCAWLLVRVLPDPADRVPPMPVYNDGVYTDKHQTLSLSETFVLDSHRQRPIVSGSDALNNSTVTTPNIPITRRLTRHKGQTVHDLNLSDVMAYDPEYGVGVRILGLKEYSGSGVPLVYLRLCSSDTLTMFTDTLHYNTSLMFQKEAKVRWSDQIHYFTHVVPSKDCFILVQVLDYHKDHYTYAGWLTVPIFTATSPRPFVHKSLGMNQRWNVSLKPGLPTVPGSLNTPGTRAEEDDINSMGAHAVVELFDSRYTSEITCQAAESDDHYLGIAERGVMYIASQQSKYRDS